jgi:hypothetical protein
MKLEDIAEPPYNITVNGHSSTTSIWDTLLKLCYEFNPLDLNSLMQHERVVVSEYHYKLHKKFINKAKVKHLYVIKDDINIIPKSSIPLNGNRPLGFKCLQALDMFIDAISLTLDVLDNDADVLLSILVSQANNFNNKYVNEVRVRSSGKTFYRRQFKISIGNSKINIFFCPISKNIRNIKVTCNPSKAHTQHLSMLFTIMHNICGDDYYRIINNAMVTKIDFTIDVPGYTVGDFLVKRQRNQYTCNYYQSNGFHESTIQGKNGCSRLTLYTQGLNNEDALEVCTRFEFSYRPHREKSMRKLFLKDYEKFKTPFSKLVVIDINQLSSLALPVDIKGLLLLGSCSYGHLCNAAQKKKLSRWLKNNSHPLNEAKFNAQKDTLIRLLLDKLLSY